MLSSSSRPNAASHARPRRLGRTQPAVSQPSTARGDVGDRLFDRAVKNGTLTEAGRLLHEHAVRLLQSWRRMRKRRYATLHHVRRGRVVIGANERRSLAAASHRAVSPSFRGTSASRCGVSRPADRRRAAREDLDFGVRPFQPPDRRSSDLARQRRQLVMLTHPTTGSRRAVGLDRGSRPPNRHRPQRSLPRARAVLRLYERAMRRSTSDRVAELDGIKRAVEMGLGVALLPRRCALAEIAAGRLAAVRVPG